LSLFEGHVGEHRLALALDVDLLRVVDHDLGDLPVVEEDLQRTETEDVVHQRLYQPFLVRPRHGHPRAPDVILGKLRRFSP